MEFNPNQPAYYGKPLRSSSVAFTDVEILFRTRSMVVARGRRFGRWWLLKFLTLESVGDRRSQNQLRREFELQMDMRHPAILSASGMEYVEGLGHCIVMEHLEGVTLREWLRRNPSKKRRRRLTDQLLDAVEYIHSRGIVHGDLRTVNLMVTSEGENIKIVDFSVASPAVSSHGLIPNDTDPDFCDDFYDLGEIIEEMHIGYGAIAKRCKLDPERTYQEVEEIRQDIDARNRRIRTSWILAFVGVIVMLGVALVVQREILDSFREKIMEPQEEAQQEETDNEIEMLTDTIDRIREENQRLNEEKSRQQLRRQMVADAISDGKRVVNESLENSDIEAHLDTLTSIDYIWFDYKTILKNVENSPQSYLDRISSSFTELEMLEIRNELEKYARQVVTPVNERIERIASWKMIFNTEPTN